MSNIDTARAAYDAFGRGDLAALKEDFAEDAVWVTSDELPLGGETRGRDAILENFAQIPNYWSSFSVEPEEFIDAGEYVVAVVRMRTKGLGSGVELDRQDAVVYRCRNDKILRVDYYNNKEQALEAAGLSE